VAALPSVRVESLCPHDAPLRMDDACAGEHRRRHGADDHQRHGRAAPGHLRRAHAPRVQGAPRHFRDAARWPGRRGAAPTPATQRAVPAVVARWHCSAASARAALLRCADHRVPSKRWSGVARRRDGRAVCVQVETEVGRPRVNYREAITQRVEFDYLHKKQSGAALPRRPAGAYCLAVLRLPYAAPLDHDSAA